MNPFYKLGTLQALQQIFGDAVKLSMTDDTTEEGNPFPTKNLPTGAELLAQKLRDESEDDLPEKRYPDNTYRRNNLDRPVSWGSPTSIDENRPTGGLMTPLNPRS